MLHAQPESRHPPAAVGVGCDHRRAPLGEQPARERLGLAAVAAGERPRVQLQHAPRGELVRERRLAFGDVAGGALRMGDDDRESAVSKLVGRRDEVGDEAVERALDEQPARAGRSERDRLELSLPKSCHHRVPELGPELELDVDACLAQALAELSQPLGELGDVARVLLAHVRRGDDRAGALGGRGGRQVDALVHRRGAVVDPRYDVEMYVNSFHPP